MHMYSFIELFPSGFIMDARFSVREGIQDVLFLRQRKSHTLKDYKIIIYINLLLRQTFQPSL